MPMKLIGVRSEPTHDGACAASLAGGPLSRGDEKEDECRVLMRPLP
jgi:hypothetical protein